MSTVLSRVRTDVYQAITDKIIRAIEAGAGPFIMPWHSHGPVIARPTNSVTGMPYRGVNVVALWSEAMLAGYPLGFWASFKQWQRLDAHVRKGERGTTIVFFKELEQGSNEELPLNDEPQRRLFASASHVFNAAQVDGWAPPASPMPHTPTEMIEPTESFVRGTGAVIRHGGNIACYRRGEDVIEMPSRDCFIGSQTSSPTASYYATLGHELIHWTGATHRLNRTFGARFGDEAYAAEELVAELGAAFLCADLGIANAPRDDHAAYIGHWLAILRDDRKAVFTAAREANHATACLHELVAQSGLSG